MTSRQLPRASLAPEKPGKRHPAEWSRRVDLRLVDIEALRPWISRRITEIVGFEDEVIIGFVNGCLEQGEVDPRRMQSDLCGFIERKKSQGFMEQLWRHLLSAQDDPDGRPAGLSNVPSSRDFATEKALAAAAALAAKMSAARRGWAPCEAPTSLPPPPSDDELGAQGGVGSLLEQGCEGGRAGERGRSPEGRSRSRSRERGGVERSRQRGIHSQWVREGDTGRSQSWPAGEVGYGGGVHGGGGAWEGRGSFPLWPVGGQGGVALPAAPHASALAAKAKAKVAAAGGGGVGERKDKSRAWETKLRKEDWYNS